MVIVCEDQLKERSARSWLDFKTSNDAQTIAQTISSRHLNLYRKMRAKPVVLFVIVGHEADAGFKNSERRGRDQTEPNTDPPTPERNKRKEDRKESMLTCSSSARRICSSSLSNGAGQRSFDVQWSKSTRSG